MGVSPTLNDGISLVPCGILYTLRDTFHRGRHEVVPHQIIGEITRDVITRI